MDAEGLTELEKRNAARRKVADDCNYLHISRSSLAVAADDVAALIRAVRRMHVEIASLRGTIDGMQLGIERLHGQRLFTCPKCDGHHFHREGVNVVSCDTEVVDENGMLDACNHKSIFRENE